MPVKAWHAHTILEQEEKSGRKVCSGKPPERTASPSLTFMGLGYFFPEWETDGDIPRATVTLLMFRSKVKETPTHSLTNHGSSCAGSKNCFVSRIWIWILALLFSNVHMQIWSHIKITMNLHLLVSTFKFLISINQLISTKHLDSGK